MATPSVALKVFGRSDIGRVRFENEDAFVIADLMKSEPIHAMPEPIAITVDSRGVLLAISDGMGGARAGEVASALALHVLRVEMPGGESGTAEAALAASVVKANGKVWTLAVNTGRQGMGATLTAVPIHERRAYVAEVGDSRAYVLRGRRFIQLTRDQSYVQQLIDEGAVTREEAETLPFRHVITQAIGTDPSIVVALNRFVLRQGDRILLCSDGLSGKVRECGYPFYWADAGLWEMSAYPSAIATNRWFEMSGESFDKLRDIHLRSASEVRGYDIQGNDDTIGCVRDFIVDNVTWSIRYLVVDTSSWWFGRKVLPAPRWASRVIFEERMSTST